MAMDCLTARTLLDASRPERRDWHDPELRAAADHAQGCVECTKALAARDTFDSRLAVAMGDVPVPEGLQQRLLDSLAAESRTLATLPAAASPPGRRTSIGRWLTTAAAVAGIAVGGWWLFSGPSQWTFAEATALLNEQFPVAEGPLSLDALAPFDGSFDASVTDLLWQEVVSAPPVGLDLDGKPGDEAAVYRFSAGRARPISGLLVVLEADQISDAPTASVPTRQFSRYDPRPQVAWRKGDRVYVCILERGTLDDLLAEMYGGTA
jgi:hypothetical protein